ncbi:PLP-dependent aminotransferase family protein [Azospirillum sp. ST 5-10]|uniref:aminotransferase-like domain-containing protein n=1 Tax=unclassified Azospirillum TaxID=2630922 RepID=UPI003F4A0470
MTSWEPDIAARPGPRYRAIADALAEDVTAGRLPPGARLPTHRDLAYRLGVTVGTITRAYAEAERRGLLGGEVGRGTFVLDPKPPAKPDPLAWHPHSEPSTVDMTAITPHQPDGAAVFAATLTAMGASGDALTALLHYVPHAGLPPHRAAAAQWLARQHQTAAPPESILITTGAQNALAVVFAAFTRTGDVVLAERLTNYGTKALAATHGLHLEPVALDDDGLLPDALDAACRRLAPKFLYLVPTLQNPTASVMSQGRREEIVAVARRHGLIIVEDDVFGFLVPDAEPIHSIAPDITIYMTSLSKSVSSGLRVGYLVAPPSLMPRLESAVRSLQYCAPPLAAEVATRWIVDGHADRFADRQRAESTARQAMARAMLPARLLCGHPAAQHLWLLLPEPWRQDDFLAEARRRGVALTGADTFAVGRNGAPHAVRIGLCMPRHREDAARGLTAVADALADPAAAALSIV